MPLAYDYVKIIKSANDYCEAGDYKSSVNLCKKILTKNPKSILALLVYGKAALRSSKHKHEAFKVFSLVLKESPRNLEALYGLMYCYEHVGESDAIFTWSKILILEKDQMKFRFILSKLTNQLRNQPNECCRVLAAVISKVNGWKYKYLCRILAHIVLNTSPIMVGLTLKQLKMIIYGGLLNQKGLPDLRLSYLCLIEFLAKNNNIDAIIYFYMCILKYNKISFDYYQCLSNFLSKFYLQNRICEKVLNFCYKLYPHCRKSLKMAMKREEFLLLSLYYTLHEKCHLYALPMIYSRRNLKKCIGLKVKYAFAANDFDHVLGLMENNFATKKPVMYSFFPLQIIKLWSRSSDPECLKLCCLAGSKLIQTDPDIPDILLCLAYACVGLQFFSLATDLIRILYKMNFNVQELNMLYAMTKPATSSVAILQLLPQSFPGILYLAELYAKIGIYEHARSAFKRCLLLKNYHYTTFDWLNWTSTPNEYDHNTTYCLYHLSFRSNYYRWEFINDFTDFLLEGNYLEMVLDILESFRKSSYDKNTTLAVEGAFKAAKIRFSTFNPEESDAYKITENLIFCIQRYPEIRSYKLLLCRAYQLYNFFAAARTMYKILFKQSNKLFAGIMAATMAKKKGMPQTYFWESRSLAFANGRQSFVTLWTFADATLQLCAKSYREKKYYLTRKLCQTAINICTRALQIDSQQVSIWKMMGDALFYCGTLPKIFQSLTLPELLFGNGVSERKIQLKGRSLLHFARRCYESELEMTYRIRDYLILIDLATVELQLAKRSRPYLMRKHLSNATFFTTEAVLILEAMGEYKEYEHNRWRIYNIQGILEDIKSPFNFENAENYFVMGDNIVTLSNLAFMTFEKRDFLVHPAYIEDLSIAIRLLDIDYALPWIINGTFCWRDHANCIWNECDVHTKEQHHLMPFIETLSDINILNCKEEILKFFLTCLPINERKISKEFLAKLSYRLDLKEHTCDDLLVYGRIVEKFTGDNKFAYQIYLEAFQKSLYYVEKDTSYLKTCLDNIARLCSYEKAEAIFPVFTCLEKTHQNIKMHIFLQLKRGNIIEAFNTLLTAMKKNHNLLKHDEGFFLYYAAMQNLRGDWHEVKKSYFIVFRKKSLRQLISLFKYAADNKDNEIMQLIWKMIYLKCRNRKYLHIPFILKAYQSENYGRFFNYFQEELSRIPHIIHTELCLCKAKIVLVLFYSFLTLKKYTTAFYWLNEFLKLPCFEGSLMEELVIGSYIAANFGKTKFCLKALHMYPNCLKLWSFFVISGVKSYKTTKQLHFLKNCSDVLIQNLNQNRNE